MDEFNFRRSHVPAFGSWDCNDDLPFTQCFETARQAGMLRYSYSEDRDLYDCCTSPQGGYPKEKEGKKEGWVVCNYDYEMKEAPPSQSRQPPKAVDEDLYKISPDLLQAQSTKKRSWSLFSCCLCPTFH